MSAFKQYLFENFLSIFQWYCYIFGLAGNLFTLALLLRRVLYFKLNLINRTTKTNIQAEQQNTASDPSKIPEDKTSIRIHRSNLVDRRNNWTLYYYIIGIVVSDIFILVCWVVSKLSVHVKLKSKFEYDVLNFEPQSVETTEAIKHSSTEKNILLDEEFTRMLASLSFADGNYSISNISSFVFRPTGDPFYIMDSIIYNLNQKYRYFSVQLMDIPGICQIYYYFSIISMHGSFSFTIACLLDRLVKLKVIHAEIVESKLKKNSYMELEYTVKNNEENANFKSPSRRALIRNTKLRGLTKSKYSEVVKQLFGKTSAYFIGMFVFLFYFHLLAIYASVPNEENETIGFFKTYFMSNYSVDDSVKISAPHRTYYLLKATTIKSRCRLISNDNDLPYYVMNLDLFLLFILCLLKLILSVVLICKYLMIRRENGLANRRTTTLKRHTASSVHFKPRKDGLMNQVDVSLIEKVAQASEESQALGHKSRTHHVFIKCVLFLAILGALCELPSVIMRNFFMLYYIFNSPSSSHSTASTALMTTTSAANDQDFLFNGTSGNLTTETTPIVTYPPLGWFTPEILASVENMSHKTDIVLLVFSSHKFFLFLFCLYFIRLPIPKMLKFGFKK
jgi:hypothetical protein